jgi:molybdenum cofactor guanylyltransferase
LFVSDSNILTNGILQPPPIQGLVLAGGKSIRMDRSKPHLVYHGVPQVKHCVDLLSPVSHRVFISLRPGQRSEVETWGVSVIEDLIEEAGPMGALLSAFELSPSAAWLLLACDMPFVTEETLQTLVGLRDPSAYATAFITSDGLPEPLLAIYEPRCRDFLQECMRRDTRSLREAIQQWGFHGIQSERAGELANVNTPADLKSAMERLKRERKG